jgi:hypothetical protein
MRAQIANQLRMTPRNVQIWFQNKRAKTRRNISEDQNDGFNGLTINGGIEVNGRLLMPSFGPFEPAIPVFSQSFYPIQQTQTPLKQPPSQAVWATMKQPLLAQQLPSHSIIDQSPKIELPKIESPVLSNLFEDSLLFGGYESDSELALKASGTRSSSFASLFSVDETMPELSRTDSFESSFEGNSSFML